MKEKDIKEIRGMDEQTEKVINRQRDNKYSEISLLKYHIYRDINLVDKVTLLPHKTLNYLTFKI